MKEDKDPTLEDLDKKGGGINPPAIEGKKVTQPAISDGGQAWSIYSALEQANEPRTTLNSEIVARYYGKQPWNQRELEAAQQDWRSNFPTHTLKAMTDKVTGTLVLAVDGLRVLTNSTLPDDEEKGEDNDNKSKVFQDKVTEVIRGWKGWRPLISRIAAENSLVGYAFACCMDEFEWRPRFFRQDELFLPEGNAQFPDFTQTFAGKFSYLIHELFSFIKNSKKKDKKENEEESRDIAYLSGWEFDNVVNALNKSMPSKEDEKGNALARTYQDMMAEVNTGQSFSTGARTVDVAAVLAIETESGKVSKFLVDRNNDNSTLYEKRDAFPSMTDVLALFSLEPGNGTVYGSRGTGRILTNICAAIDATFNNAVDAFRFANVKILHSDSKGALNAQMKLTNPFLQVTTDAAFGQEQFAFDGSAFEILLTQLNNAAEIAVQAYLPGQQSQDTGSDKRTAHEAVIDYQREQQAKAAFVARWLSQVFPMIQMMQKRLCDPETDDPQAKDLQKALKTAGLTKEEIKTLSEAPTVIDAQDLATAQNQQAVLAGERYRGNPMVDQRKLLKKDISALLSPQDADDLMLKDAIDPTTEAGNMRLQILENAAIQMGDSVNTVPTDHDKVHLDTTFGQLNHALPNIAQKVQSDPNAPDIPGLFDNLNAALVHAEAHVEQWKAKEPDNPEVEQYAAQVKQLDDQLTNAGEVVKKHKEMQAQEQQKAAQVAAASQTQAPTPPETMAQQTAPQQQGVPITERIVTAWIGQFDKLSEPEQARLKILGGLGATEEEPTQEEPIAQQPPVPEALPQGVEQ